MPTLLRHIAQTLKAFERHNGASYAAAIAYHAIISLGPCLLLSVGLVSRVFDESAVKAQVVYGISTLAGRNIANLLTQLIEDLSRPQSGDRLIAWISGGIILYASTNVFRQIVIALNAIWEVDPIAPEGGGGVATFTRRYGFALVASVGIVLVLFVTMLSSTLINLILGTMMDQASLLLTLLPWLTALALACLLFLVCWLTFTLVPGVKLDWRDTRTGALLTGLVLAVGGGIIGYVVSHSPIPNLLGLASSVVILLLWMFFSALIYLLGAEYTRTLILSRASKK